VWRRGFEVMQSLFYVEERPVSVRRAFDTVFNLFPAKPWKFLMTISGVT
jgi:hypothetical protein